MVTRRRTVLRPESRSSLSSIDTTRLALEALKHPRTIERVYGGRPCMVTTHAAVARAAAKLRLPPPPPHADQHERAPQSA